MNDFITLKELSELSQKGEPIINICGVEFYALQLERMTEKGYKYLLRYRDVIQIEYVTNYDGHWLGRVIYKTQSNMTQRGRHYAATAAMVNRHLGFKLLNEEDAK